MVYQLNILKTDVIHYFIFMVQISNKVNGMKSHDNVYTELD